ncbi:unnamed protein product, partial [Adineta ricciae]
FTMHAFSYDQYYDLIHRKDWINLAKKICESIELLSKVGADFIIIPSNTPHYAIEPKQSRFWENACKRQTLLDRVHVPVGVPDDYR